MPPPRLQLFELEDLSWFPNTVRDLATDYLHFMETRFALHKAVLPLLRTMLADSKSSCVVDLCSGGGGPVLAISEALAADEIHVQFTLTDKYPSLSAFQRLSSQHPTGIRFIANAVDATDVPGDLPGLRTMFNAFHHFAPDQARLVLEDAVRARQPIAIFEIPERSFAHDDCVFVHSGLRCIGHAFHQAISMGPLALDVCGSLGPTHVLVGRTRVRVPRIYGRRDAEIDPGSR